MQFESRLPAIGKSKKKRFSKKVRSNSTVVARLDRLNTDKGIIECTLAQNIYGYMPIEAFEPKIKEVPNYDGKGVYYPRIAPKIGTRVLVSIVSMNKNNSSKFAYELSRTKVIEDAYNKLKSMDIISCQITAITEQLLFVDCGNGVQGRIHISEAAAYSTHSLSDCDFAIGDVLQAKITDFSDELCQLSLSLKLDDISDYHENDIVVCKIRDLMPPADWSYPDDRDFFVEILNSHRTAVLHSKEIDDLEYNDTVNAVITACDGTYKIYLRFLKKL